VAWDIEPVGNTEILKGNFDGVLDGVKEARDVSDHSPRDQPENRLPNRDNGLFGAFLGEILVHPT
jgi:hypothetical protein